MRLGVGALAATGIVLAVTAIGAGSANAQSRLTPPTVESAPVIVSDLLNRPNIWRQKNVTFEVLPDVGWKVSPITTNVSICEAIDTYMDYSDAEEFDPLSAAREAHCGGAGGWRYKAEPSWRTTIPSVAFYGEFNPSPTAKMWLWANKSEMCSDVPGTKCVVQDPKGIKGLTADKVPFWRGYELAAAAAYNVARDLCAQTGSPAILIVDASELDDDDYSGSEYINERLWIDGFAGSVHHCGSVKPNEANDYNKFRFTKKDFFYRVETGVVRFPVAWSKGAIEPYSSCSFDRWSNSYICRYYGASRATVGSGTLELTIKPYRVSKVKYWRS
jgi:hypothetical protein